MRPPGLKIFAKRRLDFWCMVQARISATPGPAARFLSGSERPRPAHGRPNGPRPHQATAHQAPPGYPRSHGTFPAHIHPAHLARHPAPTQPRQHIPPTLPTCAADPTRDTGSTGSGPHQPGKQLQPPGDHQREPRTTGSAAILPALLRSSAGTGEGPWKPREAPQTPQAVIYSTTAPKPRRTPQNALQAASAAMHRDADPARQRQKRTKRRPAHVGQAPACYASIVQIIARI